MTGMNFEFFMQNNDYTDKGASKELVGRVPPAAPNFFGNKRAGRSPVSRFRPNLPWFLPTKCERDLCPHSSYSLTKNN